MKNFEKYERQYFMPPEVTYDWVKKEYITAPPIWCSVDLRDGNQALVEPMSLEEKLEFFQLLLDVGFKEIEVGFPAASETEYNFMRALIERDMIPEDVTVQVLTQAREHIIRKTFEAVKGAPHAVVHLYNSTSLAQREQVFKKSKEEILKIAVDGAKLLKSWQRKPKAALPLNTARKAFPARRWIMRWRSAMLSLMCGSPRQSRKLLSTSPLQWKMPCPIFLQGRWNI